MNDHLSVAIDIVDELENDDEFKLIEDMKNLGRKYIDLNTTDINPNDEQRMAVVLHPRMKGLRRVNVTEREQIYSVVDSFVKNKRPPGEANEFQKTDNNGTNQENRTSLDGFMDIEDDEDGSQSPYSTELHQYLSEKVMNDGVLNLREWWFSNRRRYPSLFQLFLRLSCVPASSAPSERTFSTSGAIITDRRSSLLPKSVGDIMLCRNLYRN